MTTDTTARRARGILLDKTPDSVVFATRDSNYQLRLETLNQVSTEVGDRIVGTIRARASKRFDVVNTGGRFIDPLYGRPRRLQGDIIDVDASNNTITVNAFVPVVVTVHESQKASDFAVGQFVSGDVKGGATFSVAGA